MDRSLQEFKSERTLEAFYDLAAEKQILESYVTCLRRCPARNYGPSKDKEAKRRRIKEILEEESPLEKTKKNYGKNKRDNNNHNSGKDVNTRPNDRQNHYKDSRTSSNNPISKTALLMQDGSEYEELVPEASINNLPTKESLQNLNGIYDTRLQINMIHQHLAKEMDSR
ncbi:hypothetical protein H8356DRAFT_1078034 [Neocallimastix lanati (nom. inval.)]|uniref:Uncharacterized protein n=1 Tax=Neocallimastix californiae TaxID=1754190 RepID=A0A1Y1ZXU8_9FUNG|nr:hypothetical protein H8356DRAFT_1078034 [Neocallimastix sp. JGI-2020a]ORY14605.1 hypothetical protein LY90DRAFT_518011 [Neocallimastix californiae]|eukprot:ORY14605.1 hypothetical protein LY90DRAFT_518011 [Neocallimastix californiae]